MYSTWVGWENHLNHVNYGHEFRGKIIIIWPILQKFNGELNLKPSFWKKNLNENKWRTFFFKWHLNLIFGSYNKWTQFCTMKKRSQFFVAAKLNKFMKSFETRLFQEWNKPKLFQQCEKQIHQQHPGPVLKSHGNGIKDFLQNPSHNFA